MKRHPYQTSYDGIRNVAVGSESFTPLEIACALYYSCKEKVVPTREEVASVTGDRLRHLLGALDRAAAKKDAFGVQLLERAKRLKTTEYIVIRVEEKDGVMYYGEGEASRLIAKLQETSSLSRQRAQKYISIFIRFIKNMNTGNAAYPVRLFDEVVVLIATNEEVYNALTKSLTT